MRNIITFFKFLLLTLLSLILLVSCNDKSLLPTGTNTEGPLKIVVLKDKRFQKLVAEFETEKACGINPSIPGVDILSSRASCYVVGEFKTHENPPPTKFLFSDPTNTDPIKIGEIPLNFVIDGIFFGKTNYDISVGEPITISPIKVSSKRGDSSCSLDRETSSALKDYGLKFNDKKCTISGTPKKSTPSGDGKELSVTLTAETDAINKENDEKLETTIKIKISSQDPELKLSYQGNSPFTLMINDDSSLPKPTFENLQKDAKPSCTLSGDKGAKLPKGLNFNQDDCSFSGKPSATLTKTKFKIELTEKRVQYPQSTVTEIELEVISKLSLTYLPNSSPIPTKGILLYWTPTIVKNQNAELKKCSISPPLPSGLSLHPINCIISGRPNHEETQKDYRITLEDNLGMKAETTITFKVSPGILSPVDGEQIIHDSKGNFKVLNPVSNKCYYRLAILDDKKNEVKSKIFSVNLDQDRPFKEFSIKCSDDSELSNFCKNKNVSIKVFSKHDVICNFGLVSNNKNNLVNSLLSNYWLLSEYRTVDRLETSPRIAIEDCKRRNKKGQLICYDKFGGIGKFLVRLIKDDSLANNRYMYEIDYLLGSKDLSFYFEAYSPVFQNKAYEGVRSNQRYTDYYRSSMIIVPNY